jgi:predicted AAA+ superfamily ATPase
MTNESSVRSAIVRWKEHFNATRQSLRPRGFVDLAPAPFGTALVGVRRCGKTFSSIEMSQKISTDNVFYFNFEDPVAYNCKGPEFISELLSIAAEVYRAPLQLLIFDEIQNIPGWERWVRSALDQRTHQIIITGSSASLLSGELSTSLTGRALQFERWPLSFKEFLNFSAITPHSELEHIQMLAEYEICGGFPEVILQKQPEFRKTILRQYFNDLIYKDVLGRHEVRNRPALDQIVLYYFTNPSSLHSYSALKKAFGISLDLASGYTKALIDAFMVFEVLRYHPNLKVQSRDAKKLYVIDTGMQQVVTNAHSPDRGKLLENIIYLELRRRSKKIFYYQGKQEVDFVLVEGMLAKEAIQVCAGDLTDKKIFDREISALVECMSELKLSEGTIISWNHSERIEHSGKLITILPAYRWLLG